MTAIIVVIFVSTGCFKKIAPLKLFVVFFCVKFCKFVGNSYPQIFANFCTFILKFHQMPLILPSVPIVFTVSSFEYWMQTLREQGQWRTWWESHHFQLYPDKGWKLSTVKKVCSRIDHTGSAALRKPGSGTGRPFTASACAVCRFKTIFLSVGPTKL